MNKWLLINHILPASPCLLCGTPLAAPGLCPDCHAELPHNPHACRRCALPLAAPGTSTVCGQCLKRPPPLDHCLAAFLFRPPVDYLVHRAKFRQDLAAARALGDLLAQAAAPLPVPDLLIPVPLHAARLRERGYNQALEIARALSRRLTTPIAAHACRRQRPTQTQTQLDPGQRRRNIRGAFTCRHDLRGRHLCIIDDVMTTGSTLWELARTLRQAGATRVDAWLVARATL